MRETATDTAITELSDGELLTFAALALNKVEARKVGGLLRGAFADCGEANGSRCATAASRPTLKRTSAAATAWHPSAAVAPRA